MSNQVKILAPKTRANYVEEHQDKPILMAYVRRVEEGVFQKLHPSVICRDYFGDALYSEQEKKDVGVFGFKWGPGYPERVLDRDKTRLVLKSKNEEDFNNLAKNLDVLYEIEKGNGLEETTITLSENKDEILVEGDSKWASSIFLISLYTYLLKCMCYDLGDKKDWIQTLIDSDKKESHYARNVKKEVLYLILKNLKRFGFDEKSKEVKVHGWSKEPGIHTVHSSSGWYTCTCGGVGPDKNYYQDVVRELKATLKAA